MKNKKFAQNVMIILGGIFVILGLLLPISGLTLPSPLMVIRTAEHPELTFRSINYEITGTSSQGYGVDVREITITMLFDSNVYIPTYEEKHSGDWLLTPDQKEEQWNYAGVYASWEGINDQVIGELTHVGDKYTFKYTTTISSLDIDTWNCKVIAVGYPSSLEYATDIGVPVSIEMDVIYNYKTGIADVNGIESVQHEPVPDPSPYVTPKPVSPSPEPIIITQNTLVLGNIFNYVVLAGIAVLSVGLVWRISDKKH